MSNHELVTEGPVRYPGGKDGWFTVHCTCDPTRFWWGATEAQALKPAREHKRTKDAQAAEMAVPAAELRARVLQWLEGPTSQRGLQTESLWP